MKHTIKLYTRTRCPLCDKAKKILLELQPEWNFHYEEMDISLSDELTEKYGLMIPVVELDGVEIQYGQINKLDIRNRLQEKTANF